MITITPTSHINYCMSANICVLLQFLTGRDSSAKREMAKVNCKNCPLWLISLYVILINGKPLGEAA